MAGVLTPADKDDLLARLDTTLIETGLMQVRHIEMKAAPSSDDRLQMALAASRFNRGNDGPRRDPQGEADAPQLLRVVPLHGRRIDTPGGRVVLVSLEVWTQFVTLRIGYLNSLASAADRMINHKKWHGRDDTLTTYAESHSYWSDSHGCILETRVFTPSPPPAATTLTLQADTLDGVDRLDVPLA